MALEGFPFDTSPIQTASNWYNMIQGLMETGVVSGALNEFEVTAGSGLSVDVDTGHAFIEGFFAQEESAADNVGLSAADPTNDRIDNIVLEVNFSAETYQITVLEGTPAGSPVVVSPTQTTALYQFELAHVTVQAAASSIAGGDISDQRDMISPAGGASSITSIDVEVDETEWTNDNTEKTFFQFSVPGGTLEDDNIILVEWRVNFDNDTGSNRSVNHKFKYGSTTMQSGNTSRPTGLDEDTTVTMLLRPNGGTGAQKSRAHYSSGNMSVGASGTATEDSTGDLNITVTGQMSTASASLSMAIRYAWVYVIKNP